MSLTFGRFVIAAGLVAGLIGAGCERTVSEKKTVTRTRDGTVIRDRETVKEKPDGSIVIEKDKDVDR